MTPLERLRLAVALVHAVPGAEMRATTDGGDSVVVSRHPAAHIDPCTMRRVVTSWSMRQNADLSAHLGGLWIGGGATDLGGDVYAVRIDGRDERWIPTLLPPRTVAGLLNGVDGDLVPADAMSATLKPDAELGVTLLAIRSCAPQFDIALDALAAAAAAACFVEELVASSRASQSTTEGSP